MNRAQFLRSLNAHCKANELPAPSFNARKGKGSHGRVTVGERFTTVPAGELKPGTLRAILKQLGIDPETFS